MHDQTGTEGLILRLACDLQQWKSSVLKTYHLSGSAFLSQRLPTHQDSIVVLDQKGRNFLHLQLRETTLTTSSNVQNFIHLATLCKKPRVGGISTMPLHNILKKDRRFRHLAHHIHWLTFIDLSHLQTSDIPVARRLGQTLL